MEMRNCYKGPANLMSFCECRTVLVSSRS